MSKPAFVIGGEILGIDEILGANYRGVWSPDQIYNKNDSVTYPDSSGAFFVAKWNTSGEQPEKDDVWEKRGVAVD